MTGASKFSKGGKREIDYTRPTQRTPGYWSYSRLSTFERCALQYAFQFIWKLEQPPSKAMDRGNKIHKESEDYIKGKIKGIPSSLMQFREEYAAIRKLETCVAEESYTVTKTWQPTYATDWDNAWLRAKVDIEIGPHGSTFAMNVLTVIDVKTGRVYPEHDDQAGIYGTLGFIVHPEAEQVDFEYWYVDSGEVAHHEFDRSTLREQKKGWAARSRKMLQARLYKPTPSDSNCRFCAFRSDKKLANGQPGPCQAWK